MENGVSPRQGKRNSDVCSPETHPRDPRTQSMSCGPRPWTNGQCVVAVPSSSAINPKFDLSVCKALLEKEGFQVPVEDFDAPLEAALSSSSIRRYLLFNSNSFRFIMAPVLYIVLWCTLYSSVHLYLLSNTTDFWLLCLSVTLVSILITSVLIFIFHHSNKEINMNTDVRLIPVNEKLSRHHLLVAIADWVQRCTGTMQLFCVYWDLSACLNSLTDALEEMSFVREELQKKINKRMSHLTLVTEVMALDPEPGSLHVEGGEEDDEDAEEETPLLAGNDPNPSGQNVPSVQREEGKLTKTFSLVPNNSLPVEAVAHQLLLTYSAAYIRLLVSDRLPGSPPPMQENRAHCTTATLCLCQYVKMKVLR
ncbi:transmembrane protein 268 isoform X2 [Denticeps clupeoides]|uniref:Transmembrane protein 268 n=1 Tax=Denticeps clupeoides TaxID=299321 RepID=A0AAY4EB31_9TELE|nr:transmembrane protein 268 isoform X2 [Denticeps clupeoides]XP_028819871.1 transmembrane protein 268 isoform X2 [Denticeps clupeoides]XP_028819872.1 transmembrane protein 268 isoform X2 [Denticeps clupeoides]XP_028819873.1 transmembrane protein 268 isoform X2 [Denticeps clupeoides]